MLFKKTKKKEKKKKQLLKVQQWFLFQPERLSFRGLELRDDVASVSVAVFSPHTDAHPFCNPTVARLTHCL